MLVRHDTIYAMFVRCLTENNWDLNKAEMVFSLLQVSNFCLCKFVCHLVFILFFSRVKDVYHKKHFSPDFFFCYHYCLYDSFT